MSEYNDGSLACVEGGMIDEFIANKLDEAEGAHLHNGNDCPSSWTTVNFSMVFPSRPTTPGVDDSVTATEPSP